MYCHGVLAKNTFQLQISIVNIRHYSIFIRSVILFHGREKQDIRGMEFLSTKYVKTNSNVYLVLNKLCFFLNDCHTSSNMTCHQLSKNIQRLDCTLILKMHCDSLPATDFKYSFSRFRQLPILMNPIWNYPPQIIPDSSSYQITFSLGPLVLLEARNTAYYFLQTRAVAVGSCVYQHWIRSSEQPKRQRKNNYQRSLDIRLLGVSLGVGLTSDRLYKCR